MKNKKSKIPKGIYCHGTLIPREDGLGLERINPCPYWEWENIKWYDIFWIIWRNRKILKDLKEIYCTKTYLQLFKIIYKENKKRGIYKCKYLRYKDTYQGDTLLWDECKICEVNDEEYE